MIKSGCLAKLRSFFEFKQKEKNEGFVCAPFEADIKFIFEDFEVDTEKCKGFNNKTRSLLVDNILKTMNFDPSSSIIVVNVLAGLFKGFNAQSIETSTNSNFLSKVTQKLLLKNITLGLDKSGNNSIAFAGLPYMLENKYFNEAFILHEESEGNIILNEIIVHLLQDKTYDTSEYIKELKENNSLFFQNSKKDPRTILEQSWASLRNLFKFQPLRMIREYYGEYIALYFSFTGILISSLWIPALLGVGFFTMGVINRLKFFSIQVCNHLNLFLIPVSVKMN